MQQEVIIFIEIVTGSVENSHLHITFLLSVMAHVYSLPSETSMAYSSGPRSTSTGEVMGLVVGDLLPVPTWPLQFKSSMTLLYFCFVKFY